MPQSSRPSLRALARELGTSHQLLGHYLTCWEKWQAGEYKRKAEQIRACAETETRPWVVNDMLKQAEAYDKAAFRCMLGSALADTFKRLERDVKLGRLTAGQIKMLRFIASRGDRKAQGILEIRSSAEKSKNNLPRSKRRAAKSFRSVEGVAGNSAKVRPRVRLDKTAGNTAK